LYTCELCGLNTANYFALPTHENALSDSDHVCACCHFHPYTHLLRFCPNIQCNRCFQYYYKYLSSCTFCTNKSCDAIPFNKLQMIPENYILTLD
jgi:hypothetical protein